MKRPLATIEQTVYLLAFLLALGIRLFNLGAAPLSDFEAGWALNALDVARGGVGALGPSPGYIMLTGLSIFLMGSTNFLARFWPALAGSLLVWLPYLLRREETWLEQGRIAGVIVAFGLALDPGLVALSRMAGGPMMAVSFGLLAAGFLFRGWTLPAGVFLGIALSSGAAAWSGALGLLLAWAVFRALIPAESGGSRGWPVGVRGIRNVVLFAGVTIVLVGTLFFRFPQGLGAFAATVPEFLNQWVNPSGIPASRLLFALIIYQPLALIFALVGGVKAWRQGEALLVKWVSLWALASLLIAIFNPGRQVGDLVWTLIPLWGLAGFALARFTWVDELERLPALGHAGLIFVLLALAWINMAGIARLDVALEVNRLRWLIVLGSIGLGVITTVLIALGWSVGAAWRGLVWGSALAIGLFVLSNTWGTAFSRETGDQDLWRPAPAALQVDQFISTLGDLAEWRNGRRDTLDLVVVPDAPSLRWALRDWKGAQFGPESASQSLPAAIINREDQNSPSQTVAYRGQDFAWWSSPSWIGGIPANWARWLVFREAPQRVDHVILWARGDLFPDGTLALGDESTSGQSGESGVVPPSVEEEAPESGPAE